MFSDFVQQQPHFIALKGKNSKNCRYLKSINELERTSPDYHSDEYPGWNRANWLDYNEKKKGQQLDKVAAMNNPRHT